MKGPNESAVRETWREVASGGCSFVSVVLVAFCWLVIGSWFAGEILSDRWFWTQFFEWMPTLAALIAAGGAVVTAWVFIVAWSVLARRRVREKRGAVAAAAAVVACLAVLVYFSIVELRLVSSRPPAPGAGAEKLRIVYWNASAAEKPGWELVVGGAAGDITILNGVSNLTMLPAVQELMGETRSVVYAENFTILSKPKVVRWGFTSLKVARGQGLDPRLIIGRRTPVDPGHALFLEIERPGGELMVVHVIDLPSDLSLARWEVTAKARRSMDEFDGPVHVADSLGRWSTLARGPDVPREQAVQGFPEPDVVIGDFNIPRGAASLEAVTHGFENAFTQAGRGYGASWSRYSVFFPLFHIDQAFVGPSWRAYSYRLIDPGSGSHLVQVVDLKRK